MIDTEYTSLSEIDSEVVRFYSEDARERVLGYDEETQEPIVEEYIVIVLNQPVEVPYSDVDQRRGERKPWEPTVKTELERAVEWEDFEINHTQYLTWLEELKEWEREQPTVVLDGVLKVLPAPMRPVVDIDKQREYYEVLNEELIGPEIELLEGYTTTYEDEAKLKVVTRNYRTKTTEEVEQWKLDNYEELRKAAYGTWEEQLGMQYDGTWEAHVKAVKALYPKELK